MNDTLLILIVIFGIAVLIAVQGYILLVQGQGILNPETRQRTAGRFIYTGMALVFVGSLVAVVAGILFLLNR
jgi:hypothetical protein